jgi:hypothetical protein
MESWSISHRWPPILVVDHAAAVLFVAKQSTAVFFLC